MTRNYENDALEQFVDELGEGEQQMLRLGGALPISFKEKDLGNEDIAEMIRIVEA